MSLHLTTVDGRKLDGQAAFDYWANALADHGLGTLKPDGHGGYLDTRTGKSYPAGSFSLGSGLSGPGLSIGGDQWLTPDGGVHDQHTALKLLATLAIPIGASFLGGAGGGGLSDMLPGAEGGGTSGASTAAAGAGALAGAKGLPDWLQTTIGLASIVGKGLDTYLAGQNQDALRKIQEGQLALQQKEFEAGQAARQAKIARLQPYVDTGGRALGDLYQKMGFGASPSGSGAPAPMPPTSNAPPPPSGPQPGPQPAPAPTPDVPAQTMRYGPSTLSSLGSQPTGGSTGTAPSSAPGPGLVGLRDDQGRVMYVPRETSASYLARGFQWVG